jgi:glucose/arabinose dehydrogenase
MRLIAVIVLLMTAVAASDAADEVRIALEPVVTRGLSNPVFVTHAGDRGGRLFIVEQPGRIRVVAGGTLAPAPFLDISSRVLAGGERGLLGLAFHPDYARNGRYVVNYTRRPDGATVIAEYRVSTDAGVSARDERVLLVIEQPYPNHNGGMIAFGADGFLYIGMGDGGAGGDPQNRAQNRQELLGKMLRIDVNRGSPYAIPPDNPFAGGGARPEIWALGLRNPWRFSFDRQTHELYAGDVGQNAWEEIDVVRRGGNYGWRLMEGAHCYNPARCDRQGLELPIAEYATRGGRCSVTGGYVYRGAAIPDLAGMYVYGDFCSGEIFGLRGGGTGQVLLDTKLAVSSFGEDEAGEVYVVDHRGGVYRLIAGAAGR